MVANRIRVAKLIVFSAIVTAGVGGILGIATAEIAATRYTSEMYQNLNRRYLEVGIATGAVVGAAQEAIRQVKKQKDREDEFIRWHES